MKINHALNNSFSKGFTLIELLIVIAILGILAGGVVVAINPLAKLDSANLAKVEIFDASIQNRLSINLVGEWTFNDGTAKDTSGYGNDGALSVPGPTLTTDRKGQENKAYNFDGTGDYVDAGTSSSLNPTSQITLSAWINPSAFTGSYNYFFTRRINGGAPYQVYRLNIDPTTQKPTFLLGFTDNTATSVTGTTVLSVNQWYYLVGTYDGSTMRLYLNGVQEDSATVAKTIYSNSEKTYIGVLQDWSNGVLTDYYRGKIDDVRIYNQALGLSQIQQLYAKGMEKRKIAVK